MPQVRRVAASLVSVFLVRMSSAAAIRIYGAGWAILGTNQGVFIHASYLARIAA